MRLGRFAMKILVAATLVLGLATPSLAQSEADQTVAFRAAIEAVTMPFTFDENGLDGAGAVFLRENAISADLVMMGEQHATADIANFGRLFYGEIADQGFGAYVAEVDPWSARAAEALLDQGLPVFMADARERAGGLGYPFLFFEEDAALAHAIVTHPAASETALWGVDQVFIAAGDLLAEWIESEARTDAQIAASHAFSAIVADDPMAIGSQPAHILDDLAHAFEDQADVADLLAAMRQSNAIYAPFTGRGGSIHTSNQARESLMRDQFLAHVDRARAADDLPDRLFFKFGGNHAMRGRTPTHVMGFGGFIEEWGRIEGLSFFNFMVECRGGEMSNPQTGVTHACQSYFVDPESYLAQLLPDGPAVVDLRALRSEAIAARSQLDATAFDAIFAFDALVVLPDVEAARLVGR